MQPAGSGARVDDVRAELEQREAELEAERARNAQLHAQMMYLRLERATLQREKEVTVATLHAKRALVAGSWDSMWGWIRQRILL